MADIRDILLKERMGARLLRIPKWAAWASRLKLAIRQCVVATSFWPFTLFYALIYRMHLRYALRVLRRFPGTRSIYASGGVAAGVLVYGISDIDLVVIGDWSDEQQVQVIHALQRLCRLSPLYDPALAHNAHTVATLAGVYETDFYFRYRFDQGRRSWKLMFGEDSLAQLPAKDDGLAAGGHLMAMRLWWGAFLASAFGSGPTSKDRLFRNSIAFKTTAEMIGLRRAADGGEPCDSRRTTIADAMAGAEGEDRAFLERLLVTWHSRYRRFDGDIQEEALRFMLPVMEKTQEALAASPLFTAAAGGRMTVDADPLEIPGTAAARAHANQLVDMVRREWPGFRSAFLVPAVSFFNLDDAMLLLEVDPANLPSVRQLHELCRHHAGVHGSLGQRLAISLLLGHGAYQLEAVSLLELWHLTIGPAANPEIFALLSRPEFVISGEPRTASRAPRWTPFANALVEEELCALRAAVARQSFAGRIPNLELIRNVWRHLQLEVIQRTTATGETLIPMSPAAVQRAMSGLGFPALPLLDRFREAYDAEMRGVPHPVQDLVSDLGAVFEAFGKLSSDARSVTVAVQ